MMADFVCLGSECPDTCCVGWDIPVAPEVFRKIRANLIRQGMPDPGPPTKTEGGTVLPCKTNGCVLQDGSGLCSVHSQLGESALPQVCADFPRLINRIDDRLEVTGDLACPEIARRLLTVPGSEQIVELPDSILTRKPEKGLQTRGAPPYIQVSNEVRAFIITLLQLDDFTATERLICASIFCARTITHLHRESTNSDINAIVRIMENLSDRRRLHALTDMIMREPISAHLAQPILTKTVRLASAKSPKFKPLADNAFASYRHLKGPSEPEEMWSAYEMRRAQVRARLGFQIDDAFWRMAYHDWVHSPYVLSPSLAYHAVKLQIPLVVARWLLLSQPEVVEALQQPDDRALKSVLERLLVDVTYKTARVVRHSNLIDVAQQSLTKADIDYATAAILLARM